MANPFVNHRRRRATPTLRQTMAQHPLRLNRRRKIGKSASIGDDQPQLADVESFRSMCPSSRRWPTRPETPTPPRVRSPLVTTAGRASKTSRRCMTQARSRSQAKKAVERNAMVLQQKIAERTAAQPAEQAADGAGRVSSPRQATRRARRGARQHHRYANAIDTELRRELVQGRDAEVAAGRYRSFTVGRSAHRGEALPPAGPRPPDRPMSLAGLRAVLRSVADAGESGSAPAAFAVPQRGAGYRRWWIWPWTW